jgi:predicted nucleic acid-binding protein
MFVDSNILIYNAQITSQFKRLANAAMKRAVSEGHELCISRQVLREYASTMTGAKPGQAQTSIREVSKDLRILVEKFKVLEDGPSVWVKFEDLTSRYNFGGKQVHDAYLVATMLADGETKILTHNRSDFDRFSDAIDVVAI